jgi:hypothetical protein
MDWSVEFCNIGIELTVSYNILSRFDGVRATYKTGFGLDDWIYCTLYIHTVRDYRQYSAIAILHAFQFTLTHALAFSLFNSRILATDLSQSHWHLKSHVKTSFSQSKSPSTAISGTRPNSHSSSVRSSLYSLEADTTENTIFCG